MRIRTIFWIVATAVLLSVWPGGQRDCLAVDETLPGYVTTTTDESLTIEVLSDHHLNPGDTGIIKLKGRDVAFVRVTKTEARYVYLQVISQANGVQLDGGDGIVFESATEGAVLEFSTGRELDKAVTSGQIDNQDQILQGSTLRSGSDNDFVPLLAPVAVSAKTKTTSAQDANIFHGRIRAREMYQSIPALSVYGSQSRLDTSGSIERLNASPWSMVWNGNVTYRNGNEFATAPDYHSPKGHVYTAMLARKMDDGGIFELGRFVPNQLPGLGFLDGAHQEQVVSPSWRMGSLVGFRPDRVTLDVASKEPLAAAYATMEQGDRGHLYYSGTLGIFQSLYRGALDELAMLYDHRMELGPKLNFINTSQVNFDAGSAQIHGGPRLTRLDAGLNSPLLPFLSLRTGVSRYERPDTAAERDLSGGSLIAFSNAYWRYYAGANQRLPGRLTTDEEVSLINSENQSSDSFWRLSISRTGLFALPNAQVTIAVYNVASVQGRGYNIQGSVSTPLWMDKLFLTVSSDAQYSTPDNSAKSFAVNDASARLVWPISKAWSMDAGITQTYQSYITSTISDAALSYRW
jgi:hypothetical protein